MFGALSPPLQGRCACAITRNGPGCREDLSALLVPSHEVALIDVIVTPATVSPPCFGGRRLGRARVALSLLYVVGISVPDTARKGADLPSVLVYFIYGLECIHFPGEGVEARTRRVTYSDVITGTTPHAPDLGPGVGVKSEVVLLATPVDAIVVPILTGPYTIVGTPVPDIGYAGAMPVTCALVWSSTCSVMFSLTPGVEEESSFRVEEATMEVTRVVD